MLHRLTEHCWITSSTFCRMNTVVVRRDSEAVVIDPGVTGAELEQLTAGLSELGVRRVTGLATHPHWDHLLWHPGLGDGPRYASAAAVDWLDADRLTAVRAEGAPDAPGADLASLGQVIPLPEAGLDWSGPALEFISHDAHAPGHLAVRLPADGVLVAGDMCSDTEIPLLDLDATDPLADYEAGLDLLTAAAMGCEVLVPGHGSVAAGAQAIAARLAADRRYLAGLAASEVDDERLRTAADWLIQAHAAQHARARG